MRLLVSGDTPVASALEAGGDRVGTAGLPRQRSPCHQPGQGDHPVPLFSASWRMMASHFLADTGIGPILEVTSFQKRGSLQQQVPADRTPAPARHYDLVLVQ